MVIDTFWKTLTVVGTPIGLALALLLLGRLLRRGRLTYLRWRGAAITVPVFSDGRPAEAPPREGDGQPSGSSEPRRVTLDATTRFRESLATVALQPPTPVPGAASSQEFLDLVRQRTSGANDALGRIAGLLSAAWPSTNYEVHGVSLPGDGDGSADSVSVQVVSLERGAGDPKVITGPSADEVTTTAAHVAAAQILPLSRQCKNTPWAAWYGQPLPPTLLGAYLRAQELRNERRYDECLGEYYAMIREDPLNLRLRVELGLLQEKLSLYLDALWTYRFARDLERPRWYRRLPLRPAARWGHHVQDEARLLARYRYTVMLGFGRHLALQWLRTADPDKPWSKRDHERVQLREWLRDALVSGHEEVYARLGKEPDVLREPSPGEPPGKEQLRLEAFLQAAAHQEANRLLWKLRRQWRPSLRSPGGLTRRSVRVAIRWVGYHWNRSVTEYGAALEEAVSAARTEVEESAPRALDEAWLEAMRAGAQALVAVIWFSSPAQLSNWLGAMQRVAAASERLALARSRLATLEAASSWLGPFLRSGGKQAKNEARIASPVPAGARGWLVRRKLWLSRFDVLPAAITLPDPDQVEKEVKKTLRRNPVAWRRLDWQDHYNAACTYCATIRGAEESDKTAAKCAVRHLRDVAATTHSSELSGVWDWILTEDPDLDTLRPRPEFRAFEAAFLPAERAAPVRPEGAQNLQMRAYSLRLVACAGHAFEAMWHLRAETEVPIDVHDLRRWWEEEAQAWRNAARLAKDHRHWQTRLDVRRDIAAWARRNGRAEFGFGHPRYTDRPIEIESNGDGAGPTMEEIAERARANATRGADKLRDLRSLLEPDRPLAQQNDLWDGYLRDLDKSSETLSCDDLRSLCARRAAIWGALGEWFDDDSDDDSDHGFTDLVTNGNGLPLRGRAVRNALREPALG